VANLALVYSSLMPVLNGFVILGFYIHAVGYLCCIIQCCLRDSLLVV